MAAEIKSVFHPVICVSSMEAAIKFYGGILGMRQTFDDMHDSGIYGWDFLHGLGAEHAQKWQAYLDELAAKGMKRAR